MIGARFIDRGGTCIAYRHRPGRGPALVFLPGYGSDMAGAKALALEAWAEARGHALLRVDYAGCGESGGVFTNGTIDGWRDDALAAIDAATSGPLILVGSSLGGWLMLLVALARPDRVAGLIGIAAAPDFTDWGFDAPRRAALERAGIGYEPSPYSDRPTPYTLGLWRSGQANLVLGGAIPIDCPVRLLHGQDDADVPSAVSLRLAARLRSADVQTILVKDGDHRLSRDRDLALLIATVEAMLEAS